MKKLSTNQTQAPKVLSNEEDEEFYDALDEILPSEVT